MWFWEYKKKSKCKMRDCSISIRSTRNSERLHWKMSKKEQFCGRHRNWSIWSRIWRGRYRNERNIRRPVLICLMWYWMLQSCATHIRNITVQKRKKEGGNVEWAWAWSFGNYFDVCYGLLKKGSSRVQEEYWRDLMVRFGEGKPLSDEK